MKHKIMSVKEFRRLLNSDRQIVLVHNDVRYKARTVTDVVYSNIIKYKSVFGGYGEEGFHVVKAGEIIFYIYEWNGYSSYGPRVDVESFTDMEQLKEYFKNNDNQYMLRKIFPKGSGSEEDSETY